MGQTLSFCQLNDRLWLRYALSQLHSKGRVVSRRDKSRKGDVEVEIISVDGSQVLL